MLERIRRVMYAKDWKDGRPAKGVTPDGTLALVKVLRLEQYEDVLNALDPEAETPDLPAGAPVRYLFRSEEQSVRTALDLSRPFDQAIIYGRERTEGRADLLETYLYLRGLRAGRRRVFSPGDRAYRAVQSGRHLVVFRDIAPDEDDTAALREILGAFEGVGVLHVNHAVEVQGLADTGVHVRVVRAADFDAGAAWS
jgi:hypothetical protein